MRSSRRAWSLIVNDIRLLLEAVRCPAALPGRRRHAALS